MARGPVQARIDAPFDARLSDSGVLLRPFTDADVPAVTAACRDPEIQRWIPVPSPYGEDDARTFVARCREGWHDRDAWNFAIVEATSGDLVGSISVRLVESNGQVGYWIKPEARGGGIATRALRLLSGWAFEELGLERLQLIVEPENVASQRVAERAGFTREGLLRSYMPFRDRRRDFFMYSLLPEEARR